MDNLASLADALENAPTLYDDTEAAETAAQTAEDGAPPAPPSDDGEYSTAELNRQWALVLMGSKALMMHETPDGPIEDRHAIRTIDAFRAWYANRFVMVPDGKGGTKAVTWSTRWFADRERRQYRGIVFHPAPDAQSPAPDGYFNLWRGFSFEPREKPNGWSYFRDHLFTNVCDSREDWFTYLFAWMAHLVQKPRERIGIAMVLRGGMGSGKTKVGEVIGALIRAHYFLVDDPRYVTGNFNSHMASCILLQADEAVWAGDKTAEGRLKGLITAPTQMIENKGVDPIRVDNFVRLFMTSNEGWVIPAGKDERRYCVFDVDGRCAQNADYFREIDEQLRDGGYEALLFDLLRFDLSTVDLRKVPKTKALLDQKLRSLESPDEWWLDRLKAGAPTRKLHHWPAEIPRDALYDDYIDVTERTGWKRRATEVVVGAALKKIMPDLKTVRRVITRHEGADPERVRCYVLPSLIEARAAFERSVGHPIDWEDEAEFMPSRVEPPE